MRVAMSHAALGPPAPRTCGRCRSEFPGDADLALGLESGWWACDACRGRLFGPGGRPADWRTALASAGGRA